MYSVKKKCHAEEKKRAMSQTRSKFRARSLHIEMSVTRIETRSGIFFSLSLFLSLVFVAFVTQSFQAAGRSSTMSTATAAAAVVQGLSVQITHEDPHAPPPSPQYPIVLIISELIIYFPTIYS